MARRPPKPPEKASAPRYKDRRKPSPADDDAWRSATDGEFDEILLEMGNGSDRSAAILGASYVETVLRQCLFHRLVSMSVTDARKLVGHAGPLGSFSQTIEMGFALGLYGQVVRKDLHLIREVRNIFAHRFLPVSFSDTDVRKPISKLSYRKEDISGNVDRIIEKDGDVFVRERDLYHEHCRVIVVELYYDMRMHKEARPHAVRMP
ncbi:hypothetical protein FJ957_08575 [Mesorhizobium sp. B2-4-6]|nr:hypothetical protein FJ957_08575 [Mesorhizobium sp. B2-4-6]